jgi:hypothetical protein
MDVRQLRIAALITLHAGRFLPNEAETGAHRPLQRDAVGMLTEAPRESYRPVATGWRDRADSRM